jgi:hypothetical protein
MMEAANASEISISTNILPIFSLHYQTLNKRSLMRVIYTVTHLKEINEVPTVNKVM